MLEYYASALIQGISEAFPISSSFHFLLFSQWMNPSVVPSKSMAAGLHMGSFLALCVIFRRQILALFRGFFQYFYQTPKNDLFFKERHFFTSVVVSGLGLIAGCGLFYILGFIFKTFGSATTWQDTPSLGTMALIYMAFALALEGANRMQKKRHHYGLYAFPLRDAFFMGMSQVLAMIFPGASRLGVTLTMGRLCGNSLITSTGFSLIIGMPLMAASILFSLPEVSLKPTLFFTTTGITFLSSWSMFYAMFWLARRESTLIFTLYRLLLGGLLMGTSMVR